jgi:hypothetical protein
MTAPGGPSPLTTSGPSLTTDGGDLRVRTRSDSMPSTLVPSRERWRVLPSQVLPIMVSKPATRGIRPRGILGTGLGGVMGVASVSIWRVVGGLPAGGSAGVAAVAVDRGWPARVSDMVVLGLVLVLKGGGALCAGST